MTHPTTTHWVNTGVTYGVQFTGVGGEQVRCTEDDLGQAFVNPGQATLYACHLRTIGRTDAHIIFTVTGVLDWQVLHNSNHLTPAPAIPDSNILHRIAALIGDHTESALDTHSAYAIAALAISMGEHVVAASGK